MKFPRISRRKFSDDRLWLRGKIYTVEEYKKALKELDKIYNDWTDAKMRKSK